MRSSFDPFGSCSLIVDKLIGNTYGIVEFVAKNMSHVRRASFYMKNIYDASQRLTKLVSLTGPATAGAFVDVALPTVQIEDELGTITERQVLLTNVTGWSALLVQTDGVVINADSGLFDVKLLPNGYFRVSLPGGASSTVLECPITILLSYTIPDLV